MGEQKKKKRIKMCFNVLTRLVMLTDSCPQGRAMSLDQCLQHFISSETIKEVECDNCTKVQSLLLLYCANLIFAFTLVQLTENKTNDRFKFVPTALFVFFCFFNCTCLFSQLQHGTPMNGVLESQRTTFIKQLKLGKVI